MDSSEPVDRTRPSSTAMASASGLPGSIVMTFFAVKTVTFPSLVFSSVVFILYLLICLFNIFYCFKSYGSFLPSIQWFHFISEMHFLLLREPSKSGLSQLFAW